MSTQLHISPTKYQQQPLAVWLFLSSTTASSFSTTSYAACFKTIVLRFRTEPTRFATIQLPFPTIGQSICFTTALAKTKPSCFKQLNFWQSLVWTSKGLTLWHIWAKKKTRVKIKFKLWHFTLLASLFQFFGFRFSDLRFYILDFVIFIFEKNIFRTSPPPL